MATLWKNDTCQSFNSTCRFYIRIRNLPKMACQSEIEILFSEFYIPKGGISIFGSDAFIAFANTQTAVDAFNRIQDLLHGAVMLPSLVKTTEGVKEAIRQKVRRNLNVDIAASCSETNNQETSTGSDIISDDETAEISVTAPRRKRLRPTTIPRGCRRIPFACPNFFSDEIALQRPTLENVLPRSGKNVEQLRRRKIRPQPAIGEENFKDWEMSPDECREAKRIKLEQSASGGSN